MSKLYNLKINFTNSNILKNSIWGITANLIQTVFSSLFFIIVARQYPTHNFAQFLVATTVYQLVVAFSSMGLGQWFIRKYSTINEKHIFTIKYIKIQSILGIIFYFINIILAYSLYPEGSIRLLSIILGTNIIFDNVINALKTLNVAQHLQKITASILVFDALFKLLVGCLLFVFSVSIVNLSILLIIVRFITLNIFIKKGSRNSISFQHLWKMNVSLKYVKVLLMLNWRFVVIGSISIVYWTTANIIISKLLTLKDVANYEVSYRIFSIMILIPIIASNTIYPKFIQHFNINNFLDIKRIYNYTHFLYSSGSIVTYAFIYSFSKIIIPFIFGVKFIDAVECLTHMFLTFLVFPCVLLQANLIVAMKLEKMDMLFNIFCFILNVFCCLVGLYFFKKDIIIINYSIFFSFAMFNIMQNILLIRKGFTSIKHCLLFYTSILAILFIYPLLVNSLNPYISFLLLCILTLTFATYYMYKSNFYIDYTKHSIKI